MSQQALPSRGANSAQGQKVGPGPQAEDRSRLQDLLEERLSFEGLLARLSTTFIRAPADEVDRQVEQALEQLVGFLRVHRSSLAQFSEDGRELVVTHSFTSQGHPPYPRVNIADTMPWYTAQVRRGEVLRFGRLPDELPPEAVAERDYCIQTGFRSHLIIPFKVGEEVLGGLAFGSFREEREWPDHVVLSLKLVAEVLANALARKRAEEKGRRLRDELARAARVALMGELAASIAHEVNQPLCAIVANAQAVQRMLHSGACDLDEARAALSDVTQDSLRASEVLARVRGFLKKAPETRAPVAVNEVVREVAALMRRELAHRGVAVRLELAEGLPAVLSDRVQLQQVLLNLMANGADAMEGVEKELRSLVVSSGGDGGGAVTVAVQDAGIGLGPEGADRLFAAFFTTKPSSLGMGLAICKSIVESHGGRIEARGNPGRGATFALTLPGIREGDP
jgi:signal transduction histidine kinase